jgi:hypothetical protein
MCKTEKETCAVCGAHAEYAIEEEGWQDHVPVPTPRSVRVRPRGASPILSGASREG